MFVASNNIDPYHSFQRYPAKLPDVSVHAGEPTSIDPNDYDNIIQVLSFIGSRAGIKQYGTGKREKIFVECDVVLYNILTGIIANVWRCTCCSQCFYGKIH